MLDFIKAVFFFFSFHLLRVTLKTCKMISIQSDLKVWVVPLFLLQNDKNAVWYNPAGIARMRRSRARRKLHIFTFPNLQAAWNASGLNYKEYHAVTMSRLSAILWLTPVIRSVLKISLFSM